MPWRLLSFKTQENSQARWIGLDVLVVRFDKFFQDSTIEVAACMHAYQGHHSLADAYSSSWVYVVASLAVHHDFSYVVEHRWCLIQSYLVTQQDHVYTGPWERAPWFQDLFTACKIRTHRRMCVLSLCILRLCILYLSRAFYAGAVPVLYASTWHTFLYFPATRVLSKVLWLQSGCLFTQRISENHSQRIYKRSTEIVMQHFCSVSQTSMRLCVSASLSIGTVRAGSRLDSLRADIWDGLPWMEVTEPVVML